MYDYLGGSLGTLAYAKHGRSRAINAENPTGERERAVWRQAIWEHPEKAARVCTISAAGRRSHWLR